MEKSLIFTRIFLLITLFSSSEIRAQKGEPHFIDVPGAWSSEKLNSQLTAYRSWVKVPEHWTNTSGRDLWTESVTFTIEKVAKSHELWINGKKVGSAGILSSENFQSGFNGLHRYKVPPGLLIKNSWNEILIRNFTNDGKGGFLGEAPSIQGYFLECILSGKWEFFENAININPGKALKEKPKNAAFDNFSEANRILGEASELMPGSSLSADESYKMMEADEDLQIDQILSEPEVTQPTHLSFDSRGRLWVSHYRQYPYPAGLKMISRDKYYRAKYDKEPLAPPNNYPGRSKITIHEDTNGDGQYDSHKTFLKGLDLANSTLPDSNGVWVMHTPYLLFYPDENKDDIPDGDPEVHLAGFGFEDTHSVANGLTWGPDGWIYGGQGSTVTSHVYRPGIDKDKTDGIYHEGCMVWRYHPKERIFEIFAEGGGNVFGLEFDSDGRLFSGHNGGDTRGWHYIQDAYLLKQGRTPNKFGPPANPFAFGDLPMMRGGKISRFSHNTIVCEGTALPPRMKNKFLAADPLHQYLVLSDRIERGSTFETKDLGFPLKSKDFRFRPVYLTNAPDGSIYVADFYEHYIAHGQHYQSQIDPNTGRIYRLRGKNAQLNKDNNLSELNPEQLILELANPNKWHRQIAVRLLGKINNDDLSKKLIGWTNNKKDHLALGGLWSLHQSGQLNESLCVKFLDHPYAGVRSWAVRLLGDKRSISKSTALKIKELAKKEQNLEVCSQIASSVQRIDANLSLPILSELLEKSGDLKDPNIPLMYWWAIEKHCQENSVDVVKLFENPRIRNQPMVQKEIMPRVMRRYAMSGGENNYLVCANLLSMASDDLQTKALMTGFEKAFEGGSLPSLPDTLINAIRKTGAASLLLRIRQLDPDAIKEASVKIASKEVPMEERINYVRAFGEISDNSVLPSLLKIVSGPVAPIIRKASINACQRFTDTKVSKVIIDSYKLMVPDTRLTAQKVLASRLNWSLEWMKALEQKEIESTNISEEAIAGLRRHQNETIKKIVINIFGANKIDIESPQKTIEKIRLIIESGTGNPYRGRMIYKQRCSSCHVLFHSGGKVGPDLTSYQRDDLDTMLTSIVDPNAEIREGYESIFIETNDNLSISGFLVDEGISTITLRSFDGLDKTFQKNHIKSLKPLGRSLMPANLLNGLSEHELRDFFAYLRSTQPFTLD